MSDALPLLLDVWTDTYDGVAFGPPVEVRTVAVTYGRVCFLAVRGRDASGHEQSHLYLRRVGESAEQAVARLLAMRVPHA